MPTANINEVTKAYFAGFYEGEGYVSNDKSNNNRIRLGIDQNDATPLYQAQQIWGGSVRQRVRKSPVSSKICTCHCWRLSHNDALVFLNDIKQYMRIPYKINQFEVALQKAKKGYVQKLQCRHCNEIFRWHSSRSRHEKKYHNN